MTAPTRRPLSESLPGTWQLVSRIDVDDAGRLVPEPTLGSDPVALFMLDRNGHFSAQFMRREPPDSAMATSRADAPNNTQAVGGHDAYFGRLEIDDAAGTTTQTLWGALSRGNVGMVVTRAMVVEGDTLTIRLRTANVNGVAVERTLVWRRVG